MFTGPVGLGQVVARLRHDLRRGPAPLRRVAVGVRAAVPRPDGQARRRLHRGPVAGDLDRPEVGVAQPALHRRHDHRDLRLPAAAVRAHRRPALPETAAPDHAPDPAADRRPGARSCPRAPASRCSRRSCGAARASTTTLLDELAGQGFTRARVDGEVVDLARRKLDARRATSSTRSRSSSTGSCGEPGIERRLTDSLETALRLAEGVAEVEIVRATTRTAEPEIAHVLRAPRVHALRAVVRGARAPQLLVQLALRRVRDVRRARHPLPGRPRAGRPRRRPLDRRGRDRAVVGLPRRVLQRACWSRSATEYGFSTSTPWKKLEGSGQEGRSSTAPATSRSRSATRTATAASAPTTTRYEGVIPWVRAPPHRGGVRPRPRGRSRATCAWCRAPRAAARGSGRRRWRSRSATRNIHEVGELSIRDAAEFFGTARAAASAIG